MKRGRHRLVAVLLFLFLFTAWSGPVRAERAVLSEEAEKCLSCHGRPGLTVTFENKESLDAYVNPIQYQASVHGRLLCSQCHRGFSGLNHPRRIFESKQEYRIKASLVCRRCHRVERLKANPIHATLLEEERKGVAAVCSNCHGSHAVQRVTGVRKYTSEEEYCMKCHAHSMQVIFKNKEVLSAEVNLSVVQGSVHSELSCSDCHYGFSSEEHPTRSFRTRRDYTLALSEVCRRCHFDKYTKMLESIHYAILSQGNLKAPVCIDCHGSHGIKRIGKDRTLIAKRCKRCHARIYGIYAKSVHGSALFDQNNQDVPVCTDCHTAHTVKNPLSLSFRERIPEICGNCHGNKSIVGKYGLSTAVVKNYLSDFHGITLKFYRLQNDKLNEPARPIAVCTDCHGTHNIVSTTGPDFAVIRRNLVKRCRKCHANAPPNFPNAWLSHYEPSIRRAAVVYFINLAFKIFIPILVAGLVLQILLDIWRYVANR